MAQPNFDHQGALDAGYSEDEINDFLQQLPKQSTYKPTQTGNPLTNIANNASNFLGNFGNFEKPVEEQKSESANLINQKLLKHSPNFDVQAALDAGYEPDEINDFLQQRAPEQSLLEKGGRLATQYGLGIAQGTPSGLAYDIAVAPLASKEAQLLSYRQNVMEDIEQMAEQKLSASNGIGEWTKNDEELFQHLQDQIKNPRKGEKFVKTADVSIRGLAQKAAEPFGIDLEPEGVFEKAANWAGFIKNPKNIKNLAEIGLTPKTLTKAIFPSGSEAIRGLSSGAALQMAEEGQFGPIGTLAAAVTGDLVGMGTSGTLKALTQPKKTAAKLTNLFVGSNAKKDVTNPLTGAKSKEKVIKDIISDADKAGISLDAGTLTDSDLVRFTQARLAQSALSGDALDNLRKNLSGQIVKQYESVANELGDLAFENNHQAAESVRSFVNQEEKQLFREPYSKEELKGARPLTGRIVTEERPDFQQQFLSRIAPEEFSNSYEAGETLKTVAEDIKGPIKEDFNHRWENLNRAVEEIPAGPQARLASVIETFIEDQRGSLLLGESAAENRVLQSAIKLRNALATEEGALIGVTLRDLIKTKRTLGDIANWEFGGSNFQSAYKQLVGEIDRTIEASLGEVNPQLRGAYEQLNAEYSQFKNVFENKNVIALFEPKNENFNTIYNGFLKNPDKLRSLEDMMFASPRGQQLINQVKRDYAQRVIESPNVTAREMRNLQNVLGPQSEAPIQEFLTARNRAIEQPLPRIAKQSAIGARVELPQSTSGKSLQGKGTPSAEHARRKLFEYIRNKSSDQIMKQMDTPEGIIKLRRALSLTAEGEELFKKLARYKLHEMIDRNMMDNLGENVKLGKFSGLFSSGKSEAVVKELVSPEAFTQLRLLQKNAARLQASAEKFYNASKSGTTLIDTGLASTAMIGLFSGNPYMLLKAVGTLGGMNVASRLLSNEKFLQYLKEAALTDNKEKFLGILKKMKPEVDRAVIKTSMEAREQK